MHSKSLWLEKEEVLPPNNILVSINSLSKPDNAKIAKTATKEDTKDQVKLLATAYHIHRNPDFGDFLVRARLN